MKLSKIVLKLRLQNTRFKENVVGAAELAAATENTFLKETAFVIPLSESCAPNNYDNTISQKITERFGIVVAIKNDTVKLERTGIVSFDSLEAIRTEIFKGILGWQLPDMDGIIYYVGGSVLDINPAWLWYQYEFESMRYLDQDDAVDEGYTDEFETLHTEWETFPSVNLPYTGTLPVSGFTPDLTSQVDLDDDPYDGPYNRAFGPGFDWYPSDDPWYP